MTTNITRTTWTDDDGTGTTGSILNNAQLQLIYDKIDLLIANDIAFGGKITGNINPREQTVASAATVTPTPDSADIVTITAQAAGLTLANPTPVTTVVQGRSLIVRLKDNGSSQTIAYGTQYRATNVTLPVSTVVGSTLYMVFHWNATDSKWDAVVITVSSAVGDSDQTVLGVQVFS